MSRAPLTLLCAAFLLMLLAGAAWAEGVAPTATATAAKPGPEQTVSTLAACMAESVAANRDLLPDDLQALTVPMPEAATPPPNLQTIVLAYLRVFSLLAAPTQPAAQATGDTAQAPMQMVALPMVMVKDADGWKVDLAASYEAWPEPLRKMIEARVKELQLQAADVQEITDATFEAQVLKGQGLILVDFKADWCGWCVKERVVLKATAPQMVGKVKICSLDAEANRRTAAKYGIRAFPTLILFRDGEIVERREGYLDNNQMATWLQQNLE